MNEILNINNVHGSLDKETGTAYLNAGDVARGFGFTKTETKNGVKYKIPVVIWGKVLVAEMIEKKGRNAR